MSKKEVKLRITVSEKPRIYMVTPSLITRTTFENIHNFQDVTEEKMK